MPRFYLLLIAALALCDVPARAATLKLATDAECGGSCVLPADTTPMDVCFTGETTNPTSAMIVVSPVTALDTTTVHGGLSHGFTDFTTTVQYSFTDEDAQATTDLGSTHSTSLFFKIHNPGAATIARSGTASAVAGCVRITPAESGTQYRFMLIASFGIPAKAFSECETTVADATCDIAHGFSSAPKFGIVGYNLLTAADGGSARWSTGFFTFESPTITQVAWMWFSVTGAVNGVVSGQLISNRVAASVNASAAGVIGTAAEVTAVDATNLTLTARTGTITAVGGLLFDTPLDVCLVTLDLPTTTGAWAPTTCSFKPQLVIGLPTTATAVDTAMTTSTVGSFNFFATDFRSVRTASAISQGTDPGDGNSNTASRMSSEFWAATHTQAEDFAGGSFVATATGFTASLDTADGTTRLMPLFMLQAQGGAVGVTSGPLGGPLRGAVQ